MYITISPCIECAKLIIQAGIERVVYKEFYRNDEGLRILNQTQIKVNQHV
jgi:dCMP deaminase